MRVLFIEGLFGSHFVTWVFKERYTFDSWINWVEQCRHKSFNALKRSLVEAWVNAMSIAMRTKVPFANRGGQSLSSTSNAWVLMTWHILTTRGTKPRNIVLEVKDGKPSEEAAFDCNEVSRSWSFQWKIVTCLQYLAMLAMFKVLKNQISARNQRLMMGCLDRQFWKTWTFWHRAWGWQERKKGNKSKMGGTFPWRV